MILKIAAICLISAVVYGANGASYSKVYVQSGGPDVVPVEYFNYGAPGVIASPQIARLSAAPVGSVVPVQTVSNVIPPCVSPCVVPSAGVAATAQNAKFITYSSPSVPVVVAPSKDNGYEYSYVVYDEQTGDRKAQRELSDGAVVRGEYSFLQPDGYVREVQYRADDLNGFNVVVKRILPEAVTKHQEKSEPAPCEQHENLKVEAAPEAEEPGHEGHHHHHHAGHDHEHVAPFHHEDDVVSHEAQVVEPAEVHEPEKESVEKHELEDKKEHEHAEPQPTEKEPEPEHTPEQQQGTEAHVEQVEVSHETPAVTHQAVVEAVELPHESLPSVVVSYEEVLRCLQAKGLAQKGLNFSPLTYIILPGSNKPC